MKTGEYKAIGPLMIVATLLCLPSVALAGKLPPTDAFLKKVWHAAPIVARDCIVELVSKEGRKTIESNAKLWNDKDAPLNSEELASFAANYVASSCFTAMEIDEEIHPDDPWRNPASFAHALTTKRFEGYAGLDGLQTLTALYNDHQDCLFGVQTPCKMDPRSLNWAPIAKDGIAPVPGTAVPRGHTSLAAKEAGSYLQLTATTVVHDHSAAVDDGEDRYRDFYLHTETFEVVGDLDGHTMLSAAPGLVFQFKEAVNNCAGLNVGGALTVVELNPQRVVWEGKLPAGSNSTVTPSKTINNRRIRFTVDGEEHVFNDKKAATCEPYWSRFYTYSYDVTCPAGEGQCKVRKVLLRQRHGCSSIGRCD